MIDPQQLERRPNCVVGLSSQCCSRHAGKNGLLCAVLLLGSLAHLVSLFLSFVFLYVCMHVCVCVFEYACMSLYII